MQRIKSNNKDNSFIIGDPHIGHQNILKYDSERSHFKSIYEHDEAILENCNSVLNDDSDLYILGDVFFGKKDVDYAENWLRRLKGNKYLILGNHDQLILFNKVLQRYFKRIDSYLEVEFNRQLVCLFHYPIGEWNKCHRGSWMIYGHLHDHYYPLMGYKTKCVSANKIDLKPISYKQLETYMSNKDVLTHHKVNK